MPRAGGGVVVRQMHHGETRPGRATVTLTREATTLVIKGVPASICANCGEEYVDEATTARLIKTMDEGAGRSKPALKNFPLKNADAADVATTLSQMFGPGQAVGMRSPRY